MIPEISRIYGTRVAEIRGGANIGSRWAIHAENTYQPRPKPL
jgi:hypothetical protein